ncbi:two-component response regulator [Legionella busanensis]|uniref:Two-component response regulator n=1 Tax=Legionella busanensis TaxID=190655 RepID=A0A378JMZ8_9GAMM|nr:response regulator [Legionella busanensis]STX52447.1 two-component response regulator [Legionella busanensis]
MIQPGHILLVEDDKLDADLAIKSLKNEKIYNTIDWVKDGQEALDYLRFKGTYSNREKIQPILVLLDLKMPKINGIEVLQSIRTDANLKKLPVVILTSSKEEQDLVNAYNLNVNAYVVKPVDFVQFTEAIRQIGSFWIIYNEPPPDKYV